MNILLNSVVAYQTLKTVNKLQSSDSDTCVYENKHTRVDDRRAVALSFVLGVLCGIGYMFLPETNGFSDLCYLCLYLFFQWPIITLSWDDKQSLTAMRTSWILSALLSVIMLVPFICNMDSIYIANEIDYDQVLCIGIMIIFCLTDISVPMYKLYKSKGVVSKVQDTDNDILKTLLFFFVILIAIGLVIAANVQFVSCEEVGVSLF